VPGGATVVAGAAVVALAGSLAVYAAREVRD